MYVGVAKSDVERDEGDGERCVDHIAVRFGIYEALCRVKLELET